MLAGSVAADRLAEIQAQFPAIPIVFCETDPRRGMDLPPGLARLYELELAAGTSALEETSAAPGRACHCATEFSRSLAAIRT